MAEDLVGDAVQVLVGKLIEVAGEEIHLICAVAGEMNVLKQTLRAIQSRLDDASRRQVQDSDVKLWLQNLEDVAYEADNVISEFNYALLKRQVKDQRKLKEVCFCLSFSNPSLVSRSKTAHKIKYLNATLKLINENAITYGLQEKLQNISLNRPHVEETSSFTFDPIVIGREGDVSNIVNMLISSSDSVVSVIPIVGMGGLGRTTLARQVFKDQLIEKHFSKRIWVCVSEDFNVKTIFKKILENLGESAVQVESMEAVFQKVKDKLANEKYLLVLDDVWKEDKEAWEYFNRSLLGISSNKGNCVIVTTRLVTVASNVTEGTTCPLAKLSDDVCWLIIKRKAFPREDVPKEIEAIGMEIARRCGGVPLAANMIGATLRGKEKSDWITALESGFSDSIEGENNVMHVLKLSYNRLSSPVCKNCFSYCSIFNKDESLVKEQLIQLWMAEGFLQDDDEGLDMESQGNQVFNILLQHSFFKEPVMDAYGNITHCKMHDFLHDLATSLSDGICFNGEERKSHVIPARVRYLNISSLDGEGIGIGKDTANRLRTLCLRSDIPQRLLKRSQKLADSISTKKRS